jgi:hypothetical protein
VDLKGVSSTAYPAMFKLLPKAGAMPELMAQDSASRGDVVSLFPGLSRYAG